VISLNEKEEKIKKALINSNNGLYIGQISKETGISRATVSKYLMIFEAKGEVKIEKFVNAKIAKWVGKRNGGKINAPSAKNYRS